MKLKSFQKLLLENPDAPIPNLQSTKQWRTKDIGKMPLHLFIDLERFFTESNYNDFCTIFVKKYFWQTIKVHNLFTIFENYGKQKAELYELYKYCFNPPVYGEQVAETIGSELRKDFVTEFGTFPILMDLVCKGQLINHKAVEKWKVSDFLFWADYLSGQKIIENVK